VDEIQTIRRDACIRGITAALDSCVYSIAMHVDFLVLCSEIIISKRLSNSDYTFPISISTHHAPNPYWQDPTTLSNTAGPRLVHHDALTYTGLSKRASILPIRVRLSIPPRSNPPHIPSALSHRQSRFPYVISLNAPLSGKGSRAQRAAILGVHKSSFRVSLRLLYNNVPATLEIVVLSTGRLLKRLGLP
jgi:hypothetical protein